MNNKSKKEKFNLAVISFVPIVPYRASFFKEISASNKIDLMVYFCSDYGLNQEVNLGFGGKGKWDVPLLEGYNHKFLKNWSFRRSDAPWGQFNPEIIKELRSNRYDGVLIYGWNNFTNWLTLFGKTPVFLVSETPLNQEIIKGRFKLFVKWIFLKLFFGRVSRFLYISEENKKFYRYYGVPEEKLFFMPYAVDNERFMREADELRGSKSSLKKSFGIDPQQVTIIFSGRLVPKKHPEVLLEAYAAIENENKALIFLGDGVLRSELENYVRQKKVPHVHFVGFQNQTEIKKSYSAADIFVMPSGYGETAPLAVNEAMCFSLPILMSDVIGTSRDRVHHGKNGFIFPLGDKRKLTDYLEELIADSQKRNAFGRASRAIISNASYQRDTEGILEALRARVRI